jgi:glucan phosphoethanolaminetransferase (alkaline phosphatase superfamily)
MNYNPIPFLPNPFFWCCSLFGAAVAKITTFTKKRKRSAQPQMDFNLRPSSLADFSALQYFHSWLNSSWMRGCFICSGAAVIFSSFRFKKSIRLLLPAFVIISILLISFSIHYGFTGETNIAPSAC